MLTGQGQTMHITQESRSIFSSQFILQKLLAYPPLRFIGGGISESAPFIDFQIISFNLTHGI